MMTPAIAHVVGQYQINNYLFDKAFADIDPEHLHSRPEDKANSLHFIAGHVTAARYGLANLIGIDDKCAWEDLFDRGVSAKAPSDYPSFEEIIASWNNITPKILTRLESMTEAEINAAGPEGFPGDKKTIGNAIAFLSLHESYHMGQLSYARKLLGYDGLVG